MPAELRPNWKRKSTTTTDGPRKKSKVVNVDETLKVLEQKEKKLKSKTDGGIKDYPNSDNENDVNNKKNFCFLFIFKNYFDSILLGYG